MLRFTISIVCLLFVFRNTGTAQEVPAITINANSFEAFQIVSKLKGVKAKIAITPKKINFGLIAKDGVLNPIENAYLDGFLETYADVMIEMRDEMAKKNPKMLERLKDAAKVKEGERMMATMKVMEDYLEIKADSQLFFERAEKVYWAWLKRDKRVTVEEKKK